MNQEASDFASLLGGLVDFRQQEDLERDVSSKAQATLVEEENKRDESRIQQLQQRIQKLREQKEALTLERQRKEQNAPAGVPRHVLQKQTASILNKLDECDRKISDAISEIDAFEQRILTRTQAEALKKQQEQKTEDADPAFSSSPTQAGSKAKSAPCTTKTTQQPGESRREFLIRTGKITPFASVTETFYDGRDPLTSPTKIGEEGDEDDENEGANAYHETILRSTLIANEQEALPAHESHQQLRTPGFYQSEPTTTGSAIVQPDAESNASRKRRRLVPVYGESEDVDEDGTLQQEAPTSTARRPKRSKPRESSDSEYVDSGDENDDDDDGVTVPSDNEEQPEVVTKSSLAAQDASAIDISLLDDGNEERYHARLQQWVRKRAALRQRLAASTSSAETFEEDEEEWFRPTPGQADLNIATDYRLPAEIHKYLFPFQKVGIQWLAELHHRLEGGILCDEMGLGKTVQVIAFIAALHYSKKLDGPVIIVSPSTLMPQWVKHFHTWWPPLRVSMLHSTGSGMMDPSVEDEGFQDDVGGDLGGTKKSKSRPKTKKVSLRDKSGAASAIVDRVVRHGHVLITTYKGLQTYLDDLIDVRWGYAALDEGHLIRNRNTSASRICKLLATFNRLIISGTPIQNNLRELFSLFEFSYPGLLGSDVKAFHDNFEAPIRESHHRNASSLAILTGEKLTHTLREAVKPYMLRRVKADVADDLPPKSEQVLFCKLAPSQEEKYCQVISSPEIQRLTGMAYHEVPKSSVFAAIENLRKICSHPDLHRDQHGIEDWGNPQRSVKMQVLVSLLQISRKFHHKTLVFSQSLLMLDIIEQYLRGEKFSYVRMDGRTSQTERQPMVDRFNSSNELEVFLLTPQTGGVGLTLTGADRVVLFDPSWNPAVDRQAIERAWRLGQTRPVEIYRLLTPGTIEEKIYRKQLYKQFMTDRVMRETDFQRAFDSSSIRDLFTYGTGASREDLDLFEGVKSHRSGVKEEDGEILDGNANGFEMDSKLISEAERDAVATVSNVENVEAYHDATAAMPTVATSTTSEAHSTPSSTTLSSSTANGTSSTATATNSGEKDLLGALFNKSLHNAYNHEDVLRARNKIRADRILTEQEADRLNERTVVFLREQAAMAYRARHNTALGSSSTTSSSLPRTSASSITANGNSPAPIPTRNIPYTAKRIQGLIIDFLKRSPNHAARSEAIVFYFNKKHREMPKDAFKKALQKVADLEQASRRGGSLWHLRDQYY